MPAYTLDQLLVLDTIARAGSFSAAARELHRVPSAVSYTVQSLEEAVGVELFDRSRHKAVLTPGGERFLAEARALLHHTRKLDALAVELAAGWEPEIRVVVDGAWPIDALLRALATFVERQIPTQIRVEIEYQDGVIHRFDEDHADLMVALGLEDGGRLQGLPLAPLEMLLLAAPTHPLGRARDLSRDDLAAHVDLVVKDSSPTYARTPRRSFLGTRHVIRFSDFHAKLAALRAGVGFGWLPAHLAAESMARGELVLLDLPNGNRWTYQPQLVTRRDERLGRAAQLFLDLLRAPHQDP